jgi:hypothetical protein
MRRRGCLQAVENLWEKYAVNKLVGSERPVTVGGIL